MRMWQGFTYAQNYLDALFSSSERLWRTIFTFILFVGIIVYSTDIHQFYIQQMGYKSVFDLYYGIGELVEGIVNNHEYVALMNGHSYSSHRMPFVPVMLSCLHCFSSSFFQLIVYKNIILYGSWMLLFFFLKPNNNIQYAVFVLLLLCAVNPGLVGHISGIDVEEGYITALLPILLYLFIQLLQHSRGWCALGLLLSMLLMIKSTFLLVSIGVPVLFYLSGMRNAMRSIAVVVLTMSFWAFFSLGATGKFAFGTDISSWNGWNLFKGNNVYTSEYYPQQHLDVLDGMEKVQREVLPGPSSTEWDMHRRFKRSALHFIGGHFSQWLRLTGVKLFVVFFEVRDMFKRERDNNPRILWSVVLARAVWLLMLGIAVSDQFRKPRGSLVRDFSGWYLVMNVLYIAPLIIGFAYYRHLAPLFTLAPFYFLMRSHVYREAAVAPCATERRPDSEFIQAGA